MKASHFVIEEIIDTLDDPESIPMVCNKFKDRYPNDKELRSVLCDVVDSITNNEELQKVRKELKNLANRRKYMTGASSGGTNLWMNDRRRGSAKSTLR